MPPKVITPLLQGAKGPPLGSVPVSSELTPYKSFNVPDLSGPARVLGKYGAAIESASTDIEKALIVNDKRKLVQFDIFASSVEDEILNNPGGLNSLTGYNALNRINGRSIQASPGDKPKAGETLAQSYKRRLEEASKNYDLTGLGGDTLELAIEQRAALFNKAVNVYGIEQQKVADKQAVGTLIANAIERIRSAAGVSEVRKTVLSKVKTAVMDKDHGLAFQAGLDPKTTDKDEKILIDQLLETQLAAVYVAEIEQLLADKKRTTALAVFREATASEKMTTDAGNPVGLTRGPLRGKARTELAAKLSSLSDKQTGVDLFEVFVRKHTDRKTGDVNYAAITTEAYAIEDATLQGIVLTELTSLIALKASTNRSKYALADMKIIMHFVKGGTYETLDESIVVDASPDLRARLISGSFALRQLKVTQQVTGLQDHRNLGGPDVSISGRLRYFTDLAVTDVHKFLEVTKDDRGFRGVLSLEDFEEVKDIRSKALTQLTKAEATAKTGIEFSDVNKIIVQMGYEKNTKAYKALSSNSRFTNQIDAYRVDYVKKNSRLPSQSEIHKEVGPLLLEVYDKKPLHIRQFSPDATPFIGKPGVSPIQLGEQFIDVSRLADRRRIAGLFDTSVEDVEGAIVRLKNKEIDAPTVTQLLKELGASLDTDEAPSQEQADKDIFEDALEAAGINPQVAIFSLTQSARKLNKPVPSLNLERAADIIQQLKANPDWLTKWTISYKESSE
mgnify:CR=1 FL=1